MFFVFFFVLIFVHLLMFALFQQKFSSFLWQYHHSDSICLEMDKRFSFFSLRMPCSHKQVKVSSHGVTYPLPVDFTEVTLHINQCFPLIGQRAFQSPPGLHHTSMQVVSQILPRGILVLLHGAS